LTQHPSLLAENFEGFLDNISLGEQKYFLRNSGKALEGEICLFAWVMVVSQLCNSFLISLPFLPNKRNFNFEKPRNLERRNVRHGNSVKGDDEKLK
jgi:hypothetical protein